MNVEKLGSEKISKLFLKMTIPTVIAQIINLLYNIVDRIYIGHMPEVGHYALTGAGLFMPILILINAFAALIGNGGAPLASIELGKKNYKKAQRILNTSATLMMVTSFILTLILFIFAKSLLIFFGASNNTIVFALNYGRIYILGTVFVIFTMGLNLFITAQGHSKFAMITTILGAVTNIILDPIFIFYFDMGVKGAAIATVFSQALSALWIIYFLRSPKSTIKLSLKELNLDLPLVKRILTLGSSIFVMLSTESLLSITFNHSLARYGGDIAVGAMTIITSSASLITMPISGISQGGTPILSYNYGANLKSRVKEGFNFLIKSSFTYTFIFWLIMMLIPGFTTRIFTSEPTLINYTNKAMRIYFLGIFAIGIQIPCQQSFVALNQARKSLFLAFLRKLMLLIPLIIILPNFFSDKVFAVFLAEPISDILAATVTFSMFYKWFKGYIKS